MNSACSEGRSEAGGFVEMDTLKTFVPVEGIAFVCGSSHTN